MKYSISPLIEVSPSVATTVRTTWGPLVLSGTVTMYGAPMNIGWLSFSSVTVMLMVVVMSIAGKPVGACRKMGKQMVSKPNL